MGLGGTRLFKRLIDLKYAIFQPQIKIEKNGKIFFVSSESYRWFWKQLQTGEWEPNTFKIFDTFLDSNHSYIDIGAWIGPTVLYGCQMAKHCYAIEPDPVAFKQLKNNIKLNPTLLSRISLANQCIMDSNGIAYLTPKGHGGGDSESSTVFEKSSKTWQVPGITLHQFILDNSINDCNFIKIDIEGGEFTVLPSMIEFLKEKKPTLHLSLHAPLVTEIEKKMKKIYEIVGIYNHMYDNQLREIKKEFILNEDNFSKFIEVVVSDRNPN